MYNFLMLTAEAEAAMTPYETASIAISIVALTLTLPGIIAAIVEAIKFFNNRISIKFIITEIKTGKNKNEKYIASFDLQIINCNTKTFSIYDVSFEYPRKKNLKFKIGNLRLSYGTQITANQCLSFIFVYVACDEPFDFYNSRFIIHTNQKAVKSKRLKNYIPKVISTVSGEHQNDGDQTTDKPN